jgi:hypothetical protein
MTKSSGVTVVVDTTTTFKDVMLARTGWMRLLSMSKKGSVHVAVPIVVLRETARHWEKEAADAVNQAEGRNERALKARKTFAYLGLGDLGEPPPVPDTTVDPAAFLEKLVDRLTQLGVEILPLPQVGVPEILDRDLARKKPFAESGKGFRDALVWHSVKELLARLPHGENACFVTNNTDDYCLDGDFHPDLVAEIDDLKIDFKHVRTLQELFEIDAMKPLVAQLAATRGELEAFLRTVDEVEIEEFAEPDINEVIRDALEAATSTLVDEEIATWPERGVGLDFTEVAVPDEIESPTIAYVETDPKSVDWDAYETYEEETLLIRATIDADVGIQGFVFKADYYGIEDQVDLIEFDWNDHYAFVSASVPARLVFQVRLESGVGAVENTEFELAEQRFLETD